MRNGEIIENANNRTGVIENENGESIIWRNEEISKLRKYRQQWQSKGGSGEEAKKIEMAWRNIEISMSQY